MKLSTSLAKALEFEATLDEAEARGGDFFPSRMALRAARESDVFLPRFRQRLVAGYSPSAAQLVEVPKWGGGTRPAADLALNDRLLYDALIRYLRDRIVPGLVNVSPSREERIEIEASLSQGEHEYILVADISAFYEYIQHEVLLSELLDLTAEAEAVEVLGGLLAATLQRSSGLPQGPPSSGFLADVYVSLADRRMQRDGHAVIRFSDDYRITATSWHAAIAIQIKLERALRSVGLTVNTGKTRTPTREKYATWMTGRTDQGEMRDLEGEAARAADEEEEEDDEDEEVAVPPYLEHDPGEELAPLEAPVPAIVAQFAEFVENPGFWGDRKNSERSYRMVPLLYAMATYDSDDFTDTLAILMERYPHLTREVTLGLRRRMGSGREAAALDAVDQALRDQAYLFPWQRGFLFHGVIPARAGLPAAVVDQARSELSDHEAPWFSRGRAGLALATEGLVEVDDAFRSAFVAAPAATRVDLLAVAASRASTDPDAARFVASEVRDPLLRAIPSVIQRWERRLW